MFAAIAASAVALLPLPVGPGDSPVRRHPSDGPDVDVRILVGSERVVITCLMNLAFIDAVVDTPREDDTMLHPVEYESHRLDLLDFFRQKNRVVIDGKTVEPVAKDFEVGEPDLTLLPLFPRMGRKALTKVRLVLEYPAPSPPKRVSFVWGEYPDDIALETDAGVPAMKITAQLTAKGSRELVEFTEDEPEYVWHDTGKSVTDGFAAVPQAKGPRMVSVPLLSLGFIGLSLLLGAVLGFTRGGARLRPVLLIVMVLTLIGGVSTLGVRARIQDPFAGGPELPTEAEAVTVFGSLHSNIYRAFDAVDESDIYDALAMSVHGILLDRLYNQVYRSLIMQEEGGAVSRVQKVRPVDTKVESIGQLGPEGTPGFTVKARWQVDGSVFHWGHSHSRTNEYAARYTVALTDGGWRIRDNEILEQILVSTSTTDPRGPAGVGPVKGR